MFALDDDEDGTSSCLEAQMAIGSVGATDIKIGFKTRIHGTSRTYESRQAIFDIISQETSFSILFAKVFGEGY